MVITDIILGGYPLNPGPDPAHPGGLSRKDCVVVENVTEALCFAFRTDNSGPPENIEVRCLSNDRVNIDLYPFILLFFITAIVLEISAWMGKYVNSLILYKFMSTTSCI